MSLIMWFKEPGRRGQLLWQLYGEDSETALKALDELRERGWLEDRSLRGVDLREANLSGADLREVDLEEVNLGYANLEKADLSLAELAEAVLVEANLKEANLTETNFYDANLRGANLIGASLDGTLLDRADLKFATITEEQLRQADALAGAIMPDGSSYDGRFRLEGDLVEAAELGFELDDPESMAEFYAIPLEAYQKGQEWAGENLKPSAPSTGKQEDNANDIAEASNSLWKPLNPINLILDIFDNPDEVMEYRQNPVMRQNMRVMGAWLVATLIWLPSIIPGLILLPQSMLLFEGQFSPLTVKLVVSFTYIVMFAGWILMAIACQRRRDEEKVTMILAVAIAYIYSIGLNLEMGLASLFAYLIGLIVAQHILSRRARITLAWVAMFHFAGVWKFQFNETILPSLRTSGLLETTMSAWAFSLTRYIWGAIAVLIVQYVVKSSVLCELGKHRRPVGGALLIMGYLGAFALAIWWAIMSLQ